MDSHDMGRLGGFARAQNLSKKQKSEIGRIAGLASGKVRKKQAAARRKTMKADPFPTLRVAPDVLEGIRRHYGGRDGPSPEEVLPLFRHNCTVCGNYRPALRIPEVGWFCLECLKDSARMVIDYRDRWVYGKKGPPGA